MIVGNFADLLIILSENGKKEIPGKFFLDYDIRKNRNNTHAIVKRDNSIFCITPSWLTDIIYEFEILGKNKIIEEIKDILEIKK